MSFVESYDFIAPLLDPNFGQIELWKSKDSDQLAFSVNLPADFPKDTLKRRSEWQFPNVIDLLAAELSKKPGNEGIQVYYEYFETTLSAAIVKRKGDFFKEPDVWLIVDQLLQALVALKSQGAYHGEMRPSAIYITPSKSLKVIEKGVQTSKGIARPYLAPEMVSSYRLDTEKMDVFGLGATVLEVMTLDSVLAIYEKEGVIQEEFLERFFQKAAANYSSFLVSLIRQTMSMDPSQRPTLQEIHAALHPFYGKIRQKIPFDSSKAMGMSPQQKKQLMVTERESPVRTRKRDSSAMNVHNNRVQQAIKTSQEMLKLK